MSDHAISREEVDAAIAARKELGEELEPAVVDAFVERIEQRIAARRDESERAIQRRRNHQKEMILGGMGISVPLLLIAAVFTGLPGVIAVCVALIALGVVRMIRPRRPEGQPAIAGAGPPPKLPKGHDSVTTLTFPS
jgi:hypothetical protein